MFYCLVCKIQKTICKMETPIVIIVTRSRKIKKDKSRVVFHGNLISIKKWVRRKTVNPLFTEENQRVKNLNIIFHVEELNQRIRSCYIK